MSNLTDIKSKALSEIVKIEDAAVKEYLLLKAKSYSLTTVTIVGVAAFILGLVL